MSRFISKAHNPPIIRPGQKTPFRKATAEEVRRHVEECVGLLTNQERTGQIHRHFREKYGLHWATVDQIYIVRAKKLLIERSSRTPEEAKAEGVAIRDQIIRTGTNRERLTAQARKAEIFGCNAPRGAELSGPAGGSIPVQGKKQTDEFDWDAYRKLLRGELSRSGGDGGAAGGGNGQPRLPGG